MIASDDIDRFFSHDRFLHVYGAVRDPATARTADSLISDFDLLGQTPSTPRTEGDSTYFVKCAATLDRIYHASQCLRTVGQVDKDAEGDTLCLAKEALKLAKNIYIFGYGFDRENSQLFELNKYLNYENQNFPEMDKGRLNVYFTNYGNHNSINKRASEIFYGSTLKFLKNQPDRQENKRQNIHDWLSCYEKSTKDVNGALKEDFDW